MLDIGWTELLLIGVVALIVIGPKDLPVMFHTLGRITSRARGMAREFSSAMEDAAKASGVHEATRELSDLKKLANPRSMGLDALSRAADKFEKWDPLEPVRDAAGPALGAPVPDPSAPRPPADAAAGVDAAKSAVPVAAAPHQPDTPPHQPGARRLHAVRRSDRS